MGSNYSTIIIFPPERSKNRVVECKMQVSKMETWNVRWSVKNVLRLKFSYLMFKSWVKKIFNSFGLSCLSFWNQHDSSSLPAKSVYYRHRSFRILARVHGSALACRGFRLPCICLAWGSSLRDCFSSLRHWDRRGRALSRISPKHAGNTSRLRRIYSKNVMGRLWVILWMHLMLVSTHLILTQQSQIVQLFRHIRMILAEHFLSDLQRTLAKRLSILVLSPFTV